MVTASVTSFRCNWDCTVLSAWIPIVIIIKTSAISVENDEEEMFFATIGFLAQQHRSDALCLGALYVHLHHVSFWQSYICLSSLSKKLSKHLETPCVPGSDCNQLETKPLVLV